MPTVNNSDIHLPVDRVMQILAKHDETCSPDRVGYYPDIPTLAAQVRSSKHWSMGEVFVYAKSSMEFIVMKQIAPSSCEMLTITNAGIQDVLTAYRYELRELVQVLECFMLESLQALAPR